MGHRPTTFRAIRLDRVIPAVPATRMKTTPMQNYTTTSRRRTALIAFALAAIAGSASAGPNYGAYDITVNSSNAYGGITMARKIADTTQYLYCSTSKYAGTTVSGSCYARSKTTSGYCTTQYPDMLATIRSINPSSYISFGWDASGVCNYISVANGSAYTL